MAASEVEASSNPQLQRLASAIMGRESGGNPNAVSPQGAQGSMQIMEGTFNQYKKEGELFTDDNHRRAAAGRKLADDYNFYGGDLGKTAAAYIGGRGGVNKDGSLNTISKDALGTTPESYSRQVLAKMGIDQSSAGGGGITKPAISIFGSGGGDPSTANMQQMQEDNKPSDIFGNIAVGAKTFWNNDLPADPIVHAINESFFGQNKVHDPDFIQSKEVLDRVLVGINTKYIPYITDGANSEQEMMKRRDDVLKFIEQEDRYEKAGFGSGITRLAGGMVTPMNFAVMAAAMAAPELGIPTAASRIGRIVSGAVEGGAINAGMEYATYKNRPDGAIADVGYAALMGVAFGAAGGALSHGRSVYGTEFEKELVDAQKWSLDRLKSSTAEEYASTRLMAEHDVHINRTPAEQELRIKDLEQEYHSSLHTRYVEAGLEPPKAGKPEVRTYPEKWDTPHYINEKGTEVLQLPPKQTFSDLVAYVTEHSKDRAAVAWMHKMLLNVDHTKIKFHEVGNGRLPEGWVDGHKLGNNHAAAIWTPWDSLGTKGGTTVAFAQRGKYKGKLLDHGTDHATQTGLTDATFMHEVTHIAGVYKQRLYDTGGKNGKPWAKIGIEGDQKTADAAKGIFDLHAQIMKSHGKSGHYGMTNAYEFLSEGLTNPAFQKFLKSIVLPKEQMSGNAFSKFLNNMMDLLGIDKSESTAFHRFLELADPLLDEGHIAKVGDNVSSAPVEGYRVRADGKATGDTVAAAETANVNPVWAWGLGLENRLYKLDLPKAVHNLANKLFGTTVGYENHGVVGTTVWDDHKLLSKSWNIQLRKGAMLPFMEHMRENKIPMMKQEEAHDAFFEKVWEHVHDWDGEYDPLVVKASLAMQKNYSEIVQHINNPNKSIGGKKLGLTETEHTGLDGSKTIQGTLAEDPHYMPRVHDSNKWDAMVSKHGQKTVDSFWASAYMSGRDALTTSAEDAAMFGKWYSRTVNTAKNQASSQHLTDMMRGQDRPALIESLMDVLNLDEARAGKFADQITGQTKDANGQLSGNLKHRSNINEKFVGAVGTPIEGMTIKDFVKTNAFTITEGYNDRMSGLISLAKNMDIYKVSDISKVIGDALKDDFGAGGRPKLGREAQLLSAGKDLQYAFDRILGVPQNEGFSPWKKGLEMVRNFNVIRLMGGAVFNQLVETASIVGTVGYKAMLRSIGAMDGLSRDMKTGRAPSEILNHIENYTGGVGGEYLQRLDFSSHTQWRDHYGNTKGAKLLDKMDFLISKGASGVLNKTGMTGLMVQQKRNWALSFFNGLVDISHGMEHTGASYLTPERLAHLGFSTKDFDELKVALKKHSSGTQAGVVLPEIKKFDIEGFVGSQPELHHKLMVAIMRESDRVIQENDLASMIPWMGHTLGQMGFQFQGFSMQAWNKQLMFSMNHADASTVNTMLSGVFFGSMVYSARMYQQSIGMEEEERKKFLEDRLSIHKIVANGWSRTGASSMLPNLASTLIPNASELFAGGRTTSDLSGLMANPTLGLANSLVTLGKKAVSNPLDPNKQMTKGDARALFKAMPLNNLLGVNNVINSLTSSMPVSSKETQ